MAGCDISESRLPQDGAITVKDQSNGGIDVMLDLILFQLNLVKE